ncbi:hypothetical protein LIER_26464 [Lithospermum erythrorhizon]|uniref:Uncharacterized protein n=1 Tax=Lithospermum erythrorhizon TaxID=34254 RepID=A0AAV3REB6_LITER
MINRKEDNSPNERESFKRVIQHEKVECVPFIYKDQGKTFRAGTNLDKQHASQLIKLIREFANVFAQGNETHARSGSGFGPPSATC